MFASVEVLLHMEDAMTNMLGLVAQSDAPGMWMVAGSILRSSNILSWRLVMKS